MGYNKVIVFGPTGNIGSIAAQTATKKGAKVYLAMRDPSKTIPGLSAEAEKQGKYERIQADLTDAKTVQAAVEKSGAKAAFIYLAHGSQDHMLSTFQALKDGGVQFVVFLSSFTLQRDELTSISPSELISYIHAQAELSLRKVFSREQLVTVRPGGFATNVLQHKPGIIDRKVKLVDTAAEFDWITNDDMGEVSGTVLVDGQKGGEDVIFLFGPELLPAKTAFETVGKVLGEDIEVLTVGPEEGLKEYLRGGMPEAIAKYLVDRIQEGIKSGEGNMGFRGVTHGEGVENVAKYIGRPAMTFEEWASKNKEIFA